MFCSSQSDRSPYLNERVDSASERLPAALTSSANLFHYPSLAHLGFVDCPLVRHRLCLPVMQLSESRDQTPSPTQDAAKLAVQTVALALLQTYRSTYSVQTDPDLSCGPKVSVQKEFFESWHLGDVDIVFLSVD